jgi:sugar phosphate isomerase/epimerase
MQIGLFTDSLATMTRADALDVAADLGIETVEIGLGGWSPAPHADLAELLADPAARAALRRDVTSRGLRLEAFNAAGNPLHPVDGARDDQVLRGALQLAEDLEAGTVVTMSGLPAAPGDRFPAWVTTVWPPENLRLLEHQWTVAVDYWGGLAAEARRRGVRVAVEMHANQLVYNVPGLLRLREAVGEPIGANFDPSHLIWMGADPITAIAALSGAIHHVHAKDTRIEDRAAVTSRLETIPNDRTAERAWNYVAVGTGHPDGIAFWARFVEALRSAWRRAGARGVGKLSRRGGGAADLEGGGEEVDLGRPGRVVHAGQ